MNDSKGSTIVKAGCIGTSQLDASQARCEECDASARAKDVDIGRVGERGVKGSGEGVGRREKEEKEEEEKEEVALSVHGVLWCRSGRYFDLFSLCFDATLFHPVPSHDRARLSRGAWPRVREELSGIVAGRNNNLTIPIRFLSTNVLVDSPNFHFHTYVRHERWKKLVHRAYYQV